MRKSDNCLADDPEFDVSRYGIVICPEDQLQMNQVPLLHILCKLRDGRGNLLINVDIPRLP
jgi:hypothetical protein